MVWLSASAKLPLSVSTIAGTFFMGLMWVNSDDRVYLNELITYPLEILVSTS